MTALASVLLALAGLFAERAVRVARRRPIGGSVRSRSTGSGLRRHLPAALWATGGICLLVAVGPLLTLGGAAGVATAQHVVERRRRTKRRRRGEEQLADAVTAISAGIRSGRSLPQSLAYARDEAERPLREGLDRLVGRVDVGMPVSEAVSAWAEELDSEDARLVTGVLELHRRSGGDLPSVLDGLSATLRERCAAHREVRALTAQARLSGVILGVLPIGFFGFLLLTSSGEMLDAITTPLGRTALGVGLGLEVLAFLWIRRLLEVR